MNRYEWLASLKANSWTLCRDDDHATNYMTAEEWIKEQWEWFEDTDPAELQKMKDTNTIFSFQVYPDTPIGSYTVYGASMDYVIDRMREILS